ncbi:MAG: hypothetical protein ABIJ46_03295 [bacterium]
MSEGASRQDRERTALAELNEKYGPTVDRLKEVLSGDGWMSDEELKEALESAENQDVFVLTRKAQWELDGSVDPENPTDDDLEKGNVEGAMVLSRKDGEAVLKLLTAPEDDKAFFSELEGLEGDLSMDMMVSEAETSSEGSVSFKQSGADRVSQEFAPAAWREVEKNAYSLEYRLVPASEYLKEQE